MKSRVNAIIGPVRFPFASLRLLVAQTWPTNAFIPWFPLGAGTVAGRLLERIAKVRQARLIQVALAWLLKRSPVMLPIPGTSSIVHLEENVQAAWLQLTDDEYLELTGSTQLAS